MLHLDSYVSLPTGGGAEPGGCPGCVQTLAAHRFESGSIAVSNEESGEYTVVTIEEGRERTAALLDVASTMTGVGCVIHEAIIQACRPPALHCSPDAPPPRACATTSAGMPRHQHSGCAGVVCLRSSLLHEQSMCALPKAVSRARGAGPPA